MGTTNAEIPRWPFAGSVFANTTVQVAWPAFVMNVFDPVDDVLVASPLGRGLHACDVGARIGLREAERAQGRLVEERREPGLLLLVGAREKHGSCTEPVGEDRGADAGAPPVQLLPHEHPVERRQTETAEGLGDVQVHETEPVRLRDHVRRVGGALVVLGGLRPDLLHRELASQGAQLALLRRQRERHAAGNGGLELGHRRSFD